MRCRTSVERLVDAWAQAERRGDVTLLTQLLDDRFIGVADGDAVHDKAGWIDRHRSGKLVHHAYGWRTLETHFDAHCAFVLGRVDHASSYLGHDASGRRLVTLTATRPIGEWRLTGLHASAAGAALSQVEPRRSAP